MDRSRIVIAEILRARGIRGELVARSLTDVPGRLEDLKQAHVHLMDGTDRGVIIENAWQHKGDWVLKFAGVDTMSAAEELSKADLWIAPEQRAPLKRGEFYQSDLIGCCVVDAKNGGPLGVVKGWQQHGGAPLMEVDCQGREALVPFVPEFCREVNLVTKSITMDLPDGLFDL